MKRLKTSIAAWSAVGAAALYWVGDLVLSHHQMIEISSALVLGVTTACLIRYSREAGIALRDGRGGPDILLVAIWSTMAILFMHRVYAIAMNAYNRPPELLNSPVGSFIVWMLAWSCTMFLIAPDTENGRIQTRSRVLIGFALFVAGMVSGISIAVSITT